MIRIKSDHTVLCLSPNFAHVVTLSFPYSVLSVGKSISSFSFWSKTSWNWNL